MMNMVSHLQMNDTKLRRMGTLLVPILVILAFFGFYRFLLPCFGLSLADFNKFTREFGPIQWGIFSFYPWKVFFRLIEETVTLVIVFVVLYKNEKMLPKDVGLVWSVGQGGFKQVLNLNVTIFTGLLLLSAIGLNFIQYFFGPKVANGIIYFLYNGHRGIVDFSFIAPPYEEILLRGVYCTLFIRYGFKWCNTILLTGLGFGLLHLMNHQESVLAYAIEISFATVVGWFLGWIFYKTRTLIVPILWHYAVNGFICFAVLRPDVLNKIAGSLIFNVK